MTDTTKDNDGSGVIALLESLAAAKERTTTGQWGVEEPMPTEWSIVANPNEPAYAWRFVAATLYEDEAETTDQPSRDEARLNADFFALAHNSDFTAALEEVRAMREEVARLKDKLSDGRVTPVFHRLWTAAVGQDGYDKKQWQELAALLRECGIEVQ